MADSSQRATRWITGGGFVIDAASEDDAQRTLEALERAGARAPAAVDFYVHDSGEADDGAS